MLSLIQSKWKEIIEKIYAEYDLSRISYETWVVPLRLFSADEKTGIVQIVFPGEPNQNHINYISNRFTLPFQVTIEETINIPVQVVFISEPVDSDAHVFDEEKPNHIDMNTLSLKNNLKPKYTFDSFVVGQSNKMAHAASLSVAESPALEYNPLFLHGGPGLGKTHLMHSIANFILANNPSSNVKYLTAEMLTEAVVEGIQKQKMLELKNQLKTADILLVDDIQLIIGKESTQNEFFNTFNYLYQNGKQIVISSDRPPKEFVDLDTRFKTRFEQGLIVEIGSPDYETRMAILRKKEEMDGYSIDNEVLKYIATNIKSSVRSLEGALTKINAFTKLHPGTTLTMDIVKENLSDMINPDEQNEITPQKIIKIVAEHFGIKPEDIKSSKRVKEYTTPRHISMYLIRMMTDCSQEDAGKILGNKDHSSVIYGYNKIKDSIKDDKSLEQTINLIQKKLVDNQ